MRILEEMLADIIERERAGYPVDRGALGTVIAERFGIVASTGEPYSGAAVSNALSRVRKRTAAITNGPRAEATPGAEAAAAPTTIAGHQVSSGAREAQTALAGTTGVVASQSGAPEERTVQKIQSNSPAERPRAHQGTGGPNLPPGFDDLTNPSVVDPKKPNPPKI